MNVLLAPLLARGHGTGHLRRCLALAERLGGRAAFVTGVDPEEPMADSLAAWPRVRAGAAGQAPALVVADRRATDLAAYRRLAAMGPVVGVDEGGPARRWMSFLIDTPLSGRTGANLRSASFLDLPQRRRGPGPAAIRQVLVSFGGEDPAQLSSPVAAALVEQRLFEPRQITVVRGPCFAGAADWPAGVQVLESPENLRERLHQYDLVLTAFGMTCYEALAAGVPVVLVSPTRAHRRLARRAGLPEAGLRRVRPRALRRLLSDAAALGRSVAEFRRAADAGGPTLADVIAGLRPEPSGCPVCCGRHGRRPDPAVARFADRTYFRCRSCGLLYMTRATGEAVEYGHGYFFQDYARQYGRTYLEDFEAIRLVSLGRLSVIESILGPVAGLRVLDVGCAFGPFLAAARERGADASGIEVAAEAAAYVRDRLGLRCWQGRFEEFEGPPGCCEVLSMWYVIEHFAALAPVLGRVNRLVARGGVFAFSTPNALGVSGRTRRAGFLEASPPDHFTVWDPPRARRVLARYGFRLVRVRVTGHHPERFPGAAHAGRAALRMAAAASRALGLGDTFEAYAVKVRDAHD